MTSINGRINEEAKIKGLKREIFKKYSNKCNHCGFSDLRALQIDHVNGGGLKEIRIKSNRYNYYLHIFRDKTNKYQLLCANCNWIKRHEKKEVRKKLTLNRK